MGDVSQALNLAQYLAPGFLFVQVLGLLGVARQRPVFERCAWSVILSVPLHWAGALLLPVLELEFIQKLPLEVFLLAIALAGSVVIGLVNKLGIFASSEEQEEAAD